MSNFAFRRPRDPNPPRPPPKELKENPLRWRQAFGDVIRPEDTSKQDKRFSLYQSQSPPTNELASTLTTTTSNKSRSLPVYPILKPLMEVKTPTISIFGSDNEGALHTSTTASVFGTSPSFKPGVPIFGGSGSYSRSLTQSNPMPLFGEGGWTPAVTLTENKPTTIPSFGGGGSGGSSRTSSVMRGITPSELHARTSRRLRPHSPQSTTPRTLSPTPSNWDRDTSPIRNSITFRNTSLPNFDRELEELIARPAHSNEERYKVLEGRDKLLRKRNPKVKVRVEFAVRLTGTCPDMCPEKERYMRDVQRRLSSYESIQSDSRDYEVDHRLAIKEYSRSSADQEEPLQHDLRPIEALHLTFNYLLHNIVNRIENETENSSDWYFFIWDRTRSIRKDMTQQQLSDKEAVLLMERCTRFHIYCSTRLCELDRHAFDPKLNDENLMKCLQSLEHMYSDLSLRGIHCPNEPEFRAYQILMHLNEGDIIWEIQQKPDRILKSKPVEHALKIYAAVNSRNCVAFFRLVANSSFMTSCILHRYFFQVRTMALRRFLKMYSIKSIISLPTMKVKRMLGFGDGQQNYYTFSHFCESHGLSVGDASMTMAHKSEFDQPNLMIVNRESVLIESKLNVSVSEVINGAPLGENPLNNYEPQSSFGEDGYLKREVLDELKNSLKLPITTAQRSRTPPPPAPLTLTKVRTTISQPTTKTTVGDLRQTIEARQASSVKENIVNPFARSVKPVISLFPPESTAPGTSAPPFGFRFTLPAVEAARQKAKAEEEKRKVVPEIAELTFKNVIDEVVRDEVSKIANVARAEEFEQRARAAKDKVQQEVIHEIYNQIETEVCQNLLRRIAVLELERNKAIREACVIIDEELRRIVVSQFVAEIAREIYNQRKLEHAERLEKVNEIFQRIKLRNWFLYWKSIMEERKLEEAVELERRLWNVQNFPPVLVSQLPPETILHSWSGFMPLVDKSFHEESPLVSFKRDFSRHQNKSHKTETKEKSTPPKRRKRNVVDFPPITTAQLSPATILQEWCGTRENVEKSSNEDSTSDLVKCKVSRLRGQSCNFDNMELTKSKSFTCLDSYLERKQGFRLVDDFRSFASQSEKTMPQEESSAKNLLQDIQSLLEETKQEKKLLESSFFEYEASFLN